jgi:hypothetical protein
VAGQTILKAYAPAGSDGTRVILEIDWSQVKAHAQGVKLVLLRRRPEGPPRVPDTLAFLPVDSARFEDRGLDPNQTYHYFAYFKTADSATTEFGSFPAVVHLGPLRTRPER